MAARSVQISLDEELLAEVDRRADAHSEGRSAFIRRALRQYMEGERRRAIDAQIERAYAPQDDAEDDVAELIEGQAWPEE